MDELEHFLCEMLCAAAEVAGREGHLRAHVNDYISLVLYVSTLRHTRHRERA